MAIPEGYEPKVAPKKEFDLLPEDTYEAEITKIDLKPDQPSYNDPKVLEDLFNFEFTIVDEGEFKGRKQWKLLRPVMSSGGGNVDPSWLYKIFCAANQIRLSDDEAKMVKVDKINLLEGQKIRIVVIQKADKKGKMWNRVDNVLPSKLVKPKLEADDIIQIDKDDIPF